MSINASVWAEILKGQPPAGTVLDRVTAEHRVLLGESGRVGLAARMAASVLGAGPLEALVADEAVTDVAVNGDGSVWVDRGAGMTRVALDLGDEDARRGLAVRLAALAGRRLDESAAYVDAVLPGGARLHAILPPLVPDGTHLTLRVPTRQTLGLAELQERGMFSEAWARVLRLLVRRRVAFVVSGGTGAGKTTLLAALLAECDRGERLVFVEDVAELRVDHPHVVRVQARPPNVEGAGEVGLPVLVRQALRMRPDRLVVGEVRGAEVRELLTALNTGHEGGCGTIHANSAADVVARFEALGALAGLSREAVHAQLVSAVRVVLHVARTARGQRLIASIGVLGRARDGTPAVVTAMAADVDAAETGRPFHTVDVPPGPGPAALDALLRRVDPCAG